MDKTRHYCNYKVTKLFHLIHKWNDNWAICRVGNGHYRTIHTSDIMFNEQFTIF